MEVTSTVVEFPAIEKVLNILRNRLSIANDHQTDTQKNNFMGATQPFINGSDGHHEVLYSKKFEGLSKLARDKFLLNRRESKPISRKSRNVGFLLVFINLFQKTYQIQMMKICFQSLKLLYFRKKDLINKIGKIIQVRKTHLTKHDSLYSFRNYFSISAQIRFIDRFGKYKLSIIFQNFCLMRYFFSEWLKYFVIKKNIY